MIIIFQRSVSINKIALKFESNVIWLEVAVLSIKTNENWLQSIKLKINGIFLCMLFNGKMWLLTHATFLTFLGPVNISTTAILVSPGLAVKGTMSITASEVYFEVDEDTSEYKKVDPQVRKNYTIFLFNLVSVLKSNYYFCSGRSLRFVRLSKA